MNLVITSNNGLLTFDRLCDLDDVRYESLVHVIRKTKSAIDPNAFATISNLATRLQLAMYVVKHFNRTSCTSGAFDALLRGITPESIADLAYQRKQEKYEAKETPTLPKLTLDGSCIAKSFEALDKLLQRYRGISGVPLSYDICNI